MDDARNKDNGMIYKLYNIIHARFILGTDDVEIYSLKHGFTSDEVAEWLRRWTANPMCSARVGSNPILVDSLFVTLQNILVHKVCTIGESC